MKRFATLTWVTLVATLALAQENAITPLPFKLETKQLNINIPQPQITFISPNIVTPTFNNYHAPEPIKLDFKSAMLADSLRAVANMNVNKRYFPNQQNYHFNLNPYSHDWSASGVISSMGEGYLLGSGSYSTLPGLGTTGAASLSVTQSIDERLSLTAGLSGVKYHFNRTAWNDFGIFGRASYKLNDRLSLNAFGQYYINQRYNSIAAMGYLQSSGYGGTLGIKMNDNVRLDVGVQRYYDPYTRTWRTMPILAPTIKLFNQPISFDLGGLVYQILEGLLKKHSNSVLPPGAALPPRPPRAPH